MKLTTVFKILDFKFDSHKSETKVSIFNIFITPNLKKTKKIYLFSENKTIYTGIYFFSLSKIFFRKK